MTDNNTRLNALVFASLPPPIGGIASIVQMLHASFVSRDDILFSGPKTKGGFFLANLSRPLLNLLRVVRSAFKIRRGGRVLIFSSAGLSFYEKLAWCLILKLIDRKPVLAMVDGNFPDFWKSLHPFLQALIRNLISQPTMRIGVQSQTWMEFYRGIFPNADVKIFAATVAPDFWRHGPKEPQHLMQALYIGWMIQPKGILDLLDAFSVVLTQLPNARLRLVGPLFGQEVYWNKELERRGVGDKVEIVGPISDRTELIQELIDTTVFILPSHAEGMPVSLLEAMSLGVACIASDVGAIPDMLDQGRCGCLVPARSPHILSSAIIRLLSDTAECERLGSAAFERASTHYSMEKFWSSFLHLLDLP